MEKFDCSPWWDETVISYDRKRDYQIYQHPTTSDSKQVVNLSSIHTEN